MVGVGAVIEDEAGRVLLVKHVKERAVVRQRFLTLKFVTTALSTFI